MNFNPNTMRPSLIKMVAVRTMPYSANQIMDNKIGYKLN